MALILLLFLVITSLPLPWPEPLFCESPRWALLGCVICWLAPVVWAAIVSRQTVGQMASTGSSYVRALDRYNRDRGLHPLIAMTCHLLAFGAFGWGWLFPRLFGHQSASELPFGAELLQMAPFLVGLLLAWAAFYSVEKASGLQVSRWQYVLFNARQNLAVTFIPVSLLILQQGLARTFPDLVGNPWFRAGLLTIVLTALILAPLLLRYLLGTTPLPDGPLRERLEAMAQRLGFRFSDILIWHTQHGMANAMVAGPTPWVRYVFLSDRLLDELPEPEIEAVFGHEIGHIRHGHLPYYMIFMFLSLLTIAGAVAIGSELILGPATDAASESWKSWVEWEAVPSFSLVTAYIFLVFGFLSRRCERQADLYGCHAVSCDDPHCQGHHSDMPLSPGGQGLCTTGIRIFQRALDRVAMINGISLDRPGFLQAWMHSTIQKRIDFLDDVLRDRGEASRFQRRLAVLKWSMPIVLIAILAGFYACGYWDTLSQSL